jgi:hypothetical protein
MTVLTTAPTPTLRPVSWRRLSWVAWRRYRATLVGTAVVLGAIAAYLLVRGEQMRSAYAAAQACTPQESAACRFAWDTFQQSYGAVGLIGAVLIFVPGILGAFAGAPLVARELETGTYRFAWTQGAGRTRWLLALLVPGVLGVAVVSAVFGVLVAWYHQPLVDYGDMQRLHPTVFPITGVAVVGWALMAYAAGVLAGVLAGRVVPALAATLALWTGLAFVASDLRRFHYLAPLSTSNPLLATGDQQVGLSWTLNGVPVSNAQVNQALQSIGVQITDGGGSVAAKPGGDPTDPFAWLMQHGYTQWTSYQPNSRYWPFQAIELGWLLALTALFLGLTVWLVRRRGA